MACDNKLITLREELGKLNSKLPSNVYIPFVNAQVRSSIVLSIPPGEAKIFVTKGKVPYLIAVEIFDPLEIAYDPAIGIISPKLGPEKLPAPPPPSKEKAKRTIGRGHPKTPEEILREKVEKILNMQFEPKLRNKKLMDDEPITINKVKLQRSLHGLFFLVTLFLT